MAEKDYKFLTDSGLGRLIQSAADKDFGFQGIYDPKNIGSAIYDLGAVPINKASEFLTGYNPGFSGSKFFKRRDDEGNLIDQDIAYFGVPTDATPGFDAREKRLAAEERRREVSKSRMMQNRLGDVESELTPSELIKIMQAKKIKDAKDKKALTAREAYRMKDQVEGAEAARDRRKKLIKENEKAAKEAEKFVPKDTVLGRIFDKRVKPGEEISNRDKAFAYIRNISDNLLERRLVGGKEGTDTLSRILGPGGGLEEGRLEVEALEDEATALREKGEAKAAAAIDKALERRKKELDYQKGLADVAKTYYDMQGNADPTTLMQNAEYAARMAVASGQIEAGDSAAFISNYIRLDQVGANALGNQRKALSEELMLAAPENKPAIQAKIDEIDRQLAIREVASDSTTTDNVIPYNPGATQ